DGTFGSGGSTVLDLGMDAEVRGLAVDGSGNIIVAGTLGTGTGQSGLLVRFDANGHFDPSFGVGGTVVIGLGFGATVANAVAVQSDGKIVLTGAAPTAGVTTG